jgi:hypothetical protein
MVGLEIVLRGTVEVGIAEQPEMKPRIKNLDNKATDAEEGLVLAAW